MNGRFPYFNSILKSSILIFFFPDPKRDMSGRRPWTGEEKSACQENFRQYFALGTLPGKSKILEVQKNVAILRDRTWLQIKNFIRNLVKKSEGNF